MRREGLRRVPIRNTPFFVVYRVRHDAIDIRRVIDARSSDLLIDD